MSRFSRSPLSVGALIVAGVAAGMASAGAKQPVELAGTWELAYGKTGSAKAGAICRIQLRAERSDRGDYFLGMPPACRHAMPIVATAGRWAAPDETHLTLDNPGGQALLTLAATGEGGFAMAGPDGTYALKPIPAGRSAADASTTGFEAVTPAVVPAVSPVGDPDAMAPAAPAPTRPSAPRRRAETSETTGDLAGRYAVMRDKRDTGCMITLDKTRGKGGDRAQLAPGCRDQGIVVFDPSAWQIVRGDLVLTARAGHKTKLEKQEDGVWAKDPKEGGKPLGLKKL